MSETASSRSASNDAKLFVIAAPSGAGKTTLVKKLVAKQPELRFSISYTTREKRHTEVDGSDYLFIDRDEFNRLREAGEMLEWAEVFGHLYATSRSKVEKLLAEGRNVLLEIDWQGAQQVRESMPDCVTIFILPPSLPELERRLRDRRTDSSEVIERRLSQAVDDIGHWEEFDHVIINDDLGEAVARLEAAMAGVSEETSTQSPELRRAVKRILS